MNSPIGVNGITNADIRVIVAECDDGMGDSSSCGANSVNHLLGDGRGYRPHLIRGIQPDSDLAG